MDTMGEQAKPKEAEIENLAEKAKKRLLDVDRSLKAHDFRFPKGHEARGDTPFNLQERALYARQSDPSNSQERALYDICNTLRQERAVAYFLKESGQKVPITDTVSVSMIRAPSPRGITYRHSISLDNSKDPRTSIIELSYQNSKGRSPGLIQYVSFSPDGAHDVSRGDQSSAVEGFDAILKNHGDEATRKQLGGLSSNIVREKFIAAMRVEKPLPQKV